MNWTFLFLQYFTGICEPRQCSSWAHFLYHWISGIFMASDFLKKGHFMPNKTLILLGIFVFIIVIWSNSARKIQFQTYSATWRTFEKHYTCLSKFYPFVHRQSFFFFGPQVRKKFVLFWAKSFLLHLSGEKMSKCKIDSFASDRKLFYLFYTNFPFLHFWVKLKMDFVGPKLASVRG